MINSIFVSKGAVFAGDCGLDMHSERHKPEHRFHYHDFYELMIYFGKSAALTMEGKTYPVQHGDLVFVNMFRPHLLVPEWAGQDDCFVTAHVGPEVLMAYGTQNVCLMDLFPIQGNPVRTIGEAELQKYDRLLAGYRQTKVKSGEDLLIKAVIHQLMAYAYSDCFMGVHCSLGISRDLTVITRIINYINEHLSDKFSLAALAREINYSESYICHLFKAATNRTISNYIQEKRIEVATGLLTRSIPINKVAEQAGFPNYSHFYKTFKRNMGCNPAEYRSRIESERGAR